jgi:lipopolysaccharide transport protein LptA
MIGLRNVCFVGAWPADGRAWRALEIVLLVALAAAVAGPGRAAPPGGAVVASTVTAAAVAPFVGERIETSLSGALAESLARQGLERVIGPADFVAAREFEPRASEVRRWAYNAAVDIVVVGRVSRPRSDSAARELEVVVRSGHSGAALERHDVPLAADERAEGPIDRLAAAILAGLGHVAPAATEAGAAAGPPDGRPPSAAGGSGPAGQPEDEGAGGLFETELSRSGFKNDAPIEIKADEAEIIDRRNGRKLIFQRNVRVRQANVTLRSQRLEASYRKGESDPRELIAEGGVEIVQDDRRAQCDRAVYQRDANRLTCRGHAELVQGCDVVRGESIEFDLSGDRARVEGAASIVIQPDDAASTRCPDLRGRS